MRRRSPVWGRLRRRRQRLRPRRSRRRRKTRCARVRGETRETSQQPAGRIDLLLPALSVNARSDRYPSPLPPLYRLYPHLLRLAPISAHAGCSDQPAYAYDAPQGGQRRLPLPCISPPSARDANAPPSGYTLRLTSPSLCANPRPQPKTEEEWLMKLLRQQQELARLRSAIEAAKAGVDPTGAAPAAAQQLDDIDEGEEEEEVEEEEEEEEEARRITTTRSCRRSRAAQQQPTS